MSLQFPRAKPLQACKLVAIIGTVLFAAGGFFHLIPDQQLTALLLVAVFGLGLALVVTAETLLAGYRVIRVDDPPIDRLADCPVYTAVRTGEAAIAILAAGVVVATIGTLPDEPMAGPGAIGLLFSAVVLGLLILGASLVRTLTEYYYHRRNATASTASGSRPEAWQWTPVLTE